MELIEKSPFDYLKELTLSRAAIQLRTKQIKIIDEAFDFVFDSHEDFTRAFTRQFGVIPIKYSESCELIKLFMPCRVLDYYITLQKGEVEMNGKEAGKLYLYKQ